MPTPLLLTPEIADRIVNMLKLGNYQETAAAAAGIDARTLRRWLHRGASREEEPYATFAARVLEAEASAESRHVGTLYSASREDWRAAAWILSRKSPDRWGDKVQQMIEVSGAATPAQAARLVREAFGDKVLSDASESAEPIGDDVDPELPDATD
jgi:hypothetical protein